VDSVEDQAVVDLVVLVVKLKQHPPKQTQKEAAQHNLQLKTKLHNPQLHQQEHQLQLELLNKVDF